MTDPIYRRIARDAFLEVPGATAVVVIVVGKLGMVHIAGAGHRADEIAQDLMRDAQTRIADIVSNEEEG